MSSTLCYHVIARFVCLFAVRFVDLFVCSIRSIRLTDAVLTACGVFWFCRLRVDSRFCTDPFSRDSCFAHSKSSQHTPNECSQVSRSVRHGAQRCRLRRCRQRRLTVPRRCCRWCGRSPPFGVERGRGRWSSVARDYDAAPNSGQLSFRAGDVVVVISKGEAWWLARKDNVAPAAASATTPASPGPSSSAPIGLIPSNFFDVLPAVAGIDTATPAATGRGSKRLPEPERRRYCPERRSTASARSSAS